MPTAAPMKYMYIFKKKLRFSPCMFFYLDFSKLDSKSTDLEGIVGRSLQSCLAAQDTKAAADIATSCLLKYQACPDR